jgi:hypothetical protein
MKFRNESAKHPTRVAGELQSQKGKKRAQKRESQAQRQPQPIFPFFAFSCAALRLNPLCIIAAKSRSRASPDSP